MSQKSSFRLNCQKQKNTAKKIIKHKNFQPLDGPTLQKCAKKMLNNHKKITPFTNEMCNIIISRVNNLKYFRKKIPLWLIKLCAINAKSKMHNIAIRKRLADGFRSQRGGGIVTLLIPELIAAGVEFLNHGLKLNREAKIARQKLQAKRARQKMLDDRYLAIVKHNYKPLK